MQLVFFQQGDYLGFDYFVCQFCIEVEVELDEYIVGDYVIVVGVGLYVGDLYVGWWEEFIVFILFDIDQFCQYWCCVVDRVIGKVWIGDMVLYVVNSQVVGQ